MKPFWDFKFAYKNVIPLKGKRLVLEGQKAASPYLQICPPTWEGDFPSEGVRGNNAQNDPFVNPDNAQHFRNIPVHGWQKLKSAKHSLLDEMCRETEPSDITVFSNIITIL